MLAILDTVVKSPKLNKFASGVISKTSQRPCLGKRNRTVIYKEIKQSEAWDE